MRVWNKAICALCLLALLVGLCPSPALAAAAPEAALVASWGAGAEAHTETFGSDRALQGLFSRTTASFTCGDWEILGGVLALEYSASQLLSEGDSEWTVSLNGLPLYSGHLEGGDGRRHTLLLELPVDRVLLGYNVISLEANLRGGDDEVCLDDAAASRWLTVFSESRVTVGYRVTATVDTIAAFYRQFTAIDALENGRSAVCVPENASEAALTAAAWALAGVSSNAVFEYTSLALQTGRPQAKYCLYAALLDELPDEVRSALSEAQLAAAKRGAVAALAESGQGPMLVLAGAEQSALLNAARMLANPDYMAQLTAVTKEISAETDVRQEKKEIQSYLSLTEQDVKLQGLFRQSAEFSIRLPSNRQLAESSALRLDIRYSDNLCFTRSLVTVYIDGVPIGSHKLTREGAAGERIEIALPVDLQVFGSFSVQVAFDLEMEGLWCELTPGQTPWALIQSSSLMKLALMDGLTLRFTEYPSPFLRDGTFDNCAIVLPRDPTAADLEALRGIALTLGRFLWDNTGDLSVLFGGIVQDLGEANVISVGRVARNYQARLFKSRLHLPFADDGLTLQSVPRYPVEPAWGASVGTAQLLLSPYAKKARALLLVSGVTDEGMLQAAAFLGDEQKLWRVSGDAFIADGDEAISFSFAGGALTESPELTQPAGEAASSRWLILASGVMLALVFLALLLWQKYHRKRDG